MPRKQPSSACSRYLDCCTEYWVAFYLGPFFFWGRPERLAQSRRADFATNSHSSLFFFLALVPILFRFQPDRGLNQFLFLTIIPHSPILQYFLVSYPLHLYSPTKSTLRWTSTLSLDVPIDYTYNHPPPDTIAAACFRNPASRNATQ